MKVRSRKKDPCSGRREALLLRILYAAVLLGFSGACSREHYKADADKETYKIIESKWQDEFGVMANYKINEGEPNVAEVLALVPSSGVIRLLNAVEMATQYSREYQSQKESLYLSALGLTDTRHRYDPLLFASLGADYIWDNDHEDMTGNGTAGVSQTFLLANGAQMTTELGLDWLRFLGGVPETSLSSVLTSTLAFPLLGAGAGLAAWENLTQAERNVLYRIRTFNRFRQTFVVSIITDYYRVLQQRESVYIQEASYKRLVDSTNRVRMEVEVGQRPANDLGETEQQLLRAEQSLVSARQRYEQTLDTFKIRLSLPTDANVALDSNELRALEDTGISQPTYTEQEAIDMALAHRLDLANTRDGLEDTARKLELAAKGLGIQLDLVGAARVDSQPATRWEKLLFDEGRYTLGVEADLPLDRKSERNAYRQALIAMQQDQRGYEQEVDQIKLAVRQAYRDLAETTDSYRIQQIGLRLAQRRVEAEKLSLQYGRGTVRLLLESEDALVQAQNDVLGALVDHTVAKMSFFRDVGILQVRPDGMWEQPAK